MAALHALDADGPAVVADADAAGALQLPLRRQIVEALAEPGSATTVAASLGLPRQVVNYHLRVLEKAGLIQEVGQRQRRGLKERLVRATATHFLVTPHTIGTTPVTADAFSSTYQVAVAARTIREVAALSERARAAGQRLTTLTIDTEISLASPADREAFAQELLGAVQQLAAKYSARPGRNRRPYRLFAGAHPVYKEPQP
ncbi:MAG: ArsR/SmtB family transcription factor [Vicinamibacterales bacterium]